MNKKIIICFALAMMIIGCKKVEVDFTFSPTEPRAGQVVKFNNASSAGEDWNWDFGDNVTSVLKNPTHTFTKPGTYLVTLVVDSAKYNTCSHSITVYDTIPTFTTSTDSICHYADVELTANVYNPYGYTLSYQWTLPEGCVLVSGNLNSKAITVYFTSYNQDMEVALQINKNGTTYEIARSLHIYESKAAALVYMLTDRSTMRQRIINERLEEAQINTLESNVLLLEQTSDTVVTFNGTTFHASQMSTIFPEQEVLRMQLDAMAQKWYIITPEGLFVANFNGQNLTAIDAEATGAIYVDPFRSLLFWATADGMKAMPLIKSKNNQFSTIPVLYNHINNIDRIVVNNYPQ